MDFVEGVERAVQGGSALIAPVLDASVLCRSRLLLTLDYRILYPSASHITDARRGG